MRRIAVATSVLCVIAGASSAFAARIHAVATPATVSAGGVVHVSASASPCLAGDTVTLISAAFPGHAFGVGAVYGRAGSRGAFSIRARVRAGVGPGRYHVGVRCGGGNLGVSAYFRVR
jgi:hypothetical protein